MRDYFKEFLEHKKTCPHCSTYPDTCITGHNLLLNSAGWIPKNPYIVQIKEKDDRENKSLCNCDD
jgi:hypothetical protein